jgi:formylglycine-generating enzyme
MPACFVGLGLIFAVVFPAERPVAAQNEAAARNQPSPRPTDSFSGSQAGQTRDDNGLKTKLVWIPPGNFKMGSPGDERSRRDDENQVRVTLTKGFWLGQHEVTQSEWQRVMRTTPWYRQLDSKTGDEYPVTRVSWIDAMNFCARLTETERAAGRLAANHEFTLPTEAQWEYACRAGSTTAFCFGDGRALELSAYAWYKNYTAASAGHLALHEVGRKKPNQWGLFDMHGNVREWCRDSYVDKLRGGVDPMVEIGRDRRVCRGGDYLGIDGDCRSAARRAVNPIAHDAWVGFRIAQSSAVR